MSLAYLLDEHVPRALRAAILRRMPGIQVWHIGQAGAPPVGTPDPLLLQWCESTDCVLVTNNRSSMPVISPSISPAESTFRESSSLTSA